MNNKWIITSEQLPSHENNVLAVLNGQVCVMAYITFRVNGKDKKVWGYVYDLISGDPEYDDNYYPSHWMEIPKPPKHTNQLDSKTIFNEAFENDQIQIILDKNELAVIVDNFEGGASYYMNKKSAERMASTILINLHLII